MSTVICAYNSFHTINIVVEMLYSLDNCKKLFPGYAVVSFSLIQGPTVVGNYTLFTRRDVPVGVPLDLSTPTGMSCIGTYGENCKSDNVSKYRV